MDSLQDKKLFVQGVLEKVSYIAFHALELENERAENTDLWEIMGRALHYLKMNFEEYRARDLEAIEAEIRKNKFH